MTALPLVPGGFGLGAASASLLRKAGLRQRLTAVERGDARPGKAASPCSGEGAGAGIKNFAPMREDSRPFGYGSNALYMPCCKRTLARHT